MTQSAVTVERYRVPVEHRIFGLDRRTLPFAGVALAVWVLWAVLAPAVDDVVPWSDEVTSGPWTGTPAALLNQSTIIASTVVGPEKFRLTQDATHDPDP